MISSSQKKPRDESSEDRHAVIQKGLEEFGKRAVLIGTAAISLAASVYVVGWISARTYFSYLGAAWVVPHCSLSHLLEFAFRPLYLLAFFGFLALTETFASSTAWVLRLPSLRFYIPGLAILLGLYTAILSSSGYPLAGAVLRSLYATAWALAAAETFAMLVATSENQATGTRRLYATAGLLLAVFYGLPTATGESRARAAVEHSQSDLPCAQLTDGSSPPLRLLMSTEASVYLIDLNTEHRPVRVYPSSLVSILEPSACPKSAG